jgi:hypothetical protein
VANLKNSNFEFLEAFRRTLAEANQFEIKITGAALFELAQVLLPCPLALPRSSPAPPGPTQAVRRGGRRRNTPRTPLPGTHCLARCRPSGRRQRRPTVPRGRTSDPPARERERRDRSELATPPGPPQRRASGRACPRRSGLYKPPPIKRIDAPHPQLPPRHRRSLPLALVRRSQLRRRSTGLEERRRV